MSDERDKCVRFDKLYNSIVDKGRYPLNFNTFVPWIYSVIETKIPEYINGLYYRDPMIETNRTHPITTMDSVRACSRLLNGKWMTDKMTYCEMVMMMKEGLKYGTAYGKIGHSKLQQVIKQKKVIGPGIVTEVEQLVNIENRPRLYGADFFNVYPDLSGFHMEETQFVAHDIIKTMDEIKFGPIKYKNISRLEEAGDWTDDIEDFKRYRLEESDKFWGQGSTFLNGSELIRPRKLTEFTVRTFTRKGMEIWLITVGNEKIPIREELISYWPWVFFRNCPQPHEFLGMSEVAPMESSQYALNDMTNIQMSSALMAVAKMWLVGDGADVDRDQINIDAYGIIECADPTQIVPIDFKGLDPAGFKIIQQLENSLKQASGVQDYFQGVTPPRQEYASTVLTLQNSSKARPDAGIKWAERETVSEIARAMIHCAQVSLEDPEYIFSLDGESYEEIDLTKIQGIMDFKVTGASAGVNELRRTSYSDCAKAISELLGDAMPMELRVTLAQKIASTYEGCDGVDEVLEALKTSVTSGGGGMVQGYNSNPGNSGMAGNPGAPPPQAQIPQQ